MKKFKIDFKNYNSVITLYTISVAVFISNSITKLYELNYIKNLILYGSCFLLFYFIFKKIFKTIYIKDNWGNGFIAIIICIISWFCSWIIAALIHLPYILLYIAYTLFTILAIQIHNTIAKNSELENNNL